MNRTVFGHWVRPLSSLLQSVSHQIIVRVHRVCLSTYLQAGHCPDSADGDAFTGFLRSLRKMSCLVMRYSYQHSWSKVQVIWYARHTVSSREKKKKKKRRWLLRTRRQSQCRC
ncbi:hypothetical protein TNIN_247121 [Trichonephila inaurata madagascariensis]|uniref:Uncharacterized protein n=1 Tax=Trichonephila inaurata madagascariensis TaxID=2747483 RepID=A0A8X6WQM3_9ARAC|nr:hypothetical protein TNIN_247121 [Trichonephila inaurata madagascariensis]